MTMMPESDLLSPLAQRLRAFDGQMSKSEAILAQWLERNEAALGLETGASIAATTGLSEITVSRFLRRLGYKGLAALKEDLRHAGTAQLPTADMYVRLLDGELGTLIRRDAEAMLALSVQVARPEWAAAIQAISTADEVFVTGFQTVRGVAEDFARRLAIVRDRVRFVSAHDGGLAEWIGRPAPISLLILVDTVPYAREAEPILRAAVARGPAIVVTDELNTWANTHTPYVFSVATRVGTFVESTGPLASLLNLVTHAVAASQPAASKDRLTVWPVLLRELGLFT